MSARREKRLRSLERRVQKLEVMASAGFLESNLREELAKANNRPELTEGNKKRAASPEGVTARDYCYHTTEEATFQWEIERNLRTLSNWR